VLRGGLLLHRAVLLCDDYPAASSRCCAYLARDPGGVRISHAAFALANPISGDLIRMTNRDWQFSTDEVRRTSA
jgi:glucokinase